MNRIGKYEGVVRLVLLLVVLALAGGLEEPLSELLLSALACAGIALIMNAVAYGRAVG